MKYFVVMVPKKPIDFPRSYVYSHDDLIWAKRDYAKRVSMYGETYDIYLSEHVSVAECKYHDEKYHVEKGPEVKVLQHKEPYCVWHIVNVYGEKCFNEYGFLMYTSAELAQEYCDKMNLMPEGGICTNFI
jgi:hypothetical protein